MDHSSLHLAANNATEADINLKNSNVSITLENGNLKVNAADSSFGVRFVGFGTASINVSNCFMSSTIILRDNDV